MHALQVLLDDCQTHAQALLQGQPSRVQRFALYAQSASRHRRAAQALGLHLHPSLVQTHTPLHSRHPLYAKVIYHADAWTLYGQSPPVLVFDKQQRMTLHAPVVDDEADVEGDDGQAEEDLEEAARSQGEEVVEVEGQREPNMAADRRAQAPPASLGAIWREHAGIQPLLSKYLLQHLQVRLGELAGESHAFFGVPLHPRHAFQTLHNKLFPTDALPERLEQVLWGRTGDEVRTAPSQGLNCQT